jgi:DNA segregation ATPase FtsK/SpoIIIE, S-DNA-T family
MGNQFEVKDNSPQTQIRTNETKNSSEFDSSKLPVEMRRIVSAINAIVDHYELRVSNITATQSSARERADKELAEAEKTFSEKKTLMAQNRDSQKTAADAVIANVAKADDWAHDFVRRQSVEPPVSFDLTPTSVTPMKGCLEEAQRLSKEGNAVALTLNEIKKPTGTGGLFAAFGGLGFIISICAAANASGGDGPATFFLINGLSLAVAGGITFARFAMWKSEIQTRFSRWLDQKATAESYATAAHEFADAEYKRELTAAQTQFRNSQQKNKEAKQQADSDYGVALTVLKQESIPLIRKMKVECSALSVQAGFSSLSWNADAWKTWQPPAATSFAACMARLAIGPVKTPPTHQGLDIKFEVPAFIPFAVGKEGRCLLFKCAGAAKEKASRSVQSLITRLLATVPPAKVKFTFIDPVGLGQNVSSFMHLTDFDDSLVSGKAWTEPNHIEHQLLELTEHMETVIQKYLRNDFESIEQYNASAGEIAEAYRVLVVFDFPGNFTETAARRLVSIAENGPRCGVYTIVISDTSAEKRLPYGFTPADLERTSNVMEYNSGRFIWRDDCFKRHTITLDEPPGPEFSKHIIKTIGAQAKSTLNVQVPYGKLLTRADLSVDTFWRKGTENLIEAPLGPHGATKIQSLTLGEKTAHHAIVVGRTGSGKSNLMHVIITSLSLAYSPDEIELYLVDFKQGVEFKPYATFGLPHARVIAIESEREFGISVLQGLDAELHKRGDLFRANNVNNITDYRKKVGVLSRILLLVDEFQEFFSHDDNIAAQARMILDRLVRQGRSQGIHVMLGSQTLKGASDLPHNIISQMGIRIALQCTEADARQIMGDDNLVNRQLTRPGEAIYNSESGQVEANKLFQVALFTEQDREVSFSQITELAKNAGRIFPGPLVFEGNEAARLQNCLPLKQNIQLDQWSPNAKVADAWLGEPIAIKPPATARFRRQGGSHLLVVTRDEPQGVGTVLAALTCLLTQYDPTAARFFIVNMTTADSEWSELPGSFPDLYPHEIQMVGRRNLVGVLQSLAKLADERANEEHANFQEVFLLFLGLHRARDLRDENDGASYYKSGDDSTPDAKALFAKVMREGPESGIHVIAWCDAYSNLTRIDRRLIGEFALRVAGPMSGDDSQHVIDDSLASKLDRPHRAILFDEERPGQLEKFRPYAIPEIGWLRSVGEQLRARNQRSQKASGG